MVQHMPDSKEKRDFMEADDLAKQGKFAESVEAAKHNLEDWTLSRYWRIKNYILWMSVGDDWDEAQGLLEQCEHLVSITESKVAENDELGQLGLRELRFQLKEMRDRQERDRREGMAMNPELYESGDFDEDYEKERVWPGVDAEVIDYEWYEPGDENRPEPGNTEAHYATDPDGLPVATNDSAPIAADTTSLDKDVSDKLSHKTKEEMEVSETQMLDSTDDSRPPVSQRKAAKQKNKHVSSAFKTMVHRSRTAISHESTAPPSVQSTFAVEKPFEETDEGEDASSD